MIFQYTVEGLQPATNYAFRVATVNDAVSPHSNQSSFSTQVGCWTRAAMSQEPNTLIVSLEQSRQFTLNWTKPSITNGNLNGYRLTVFEGSTCVQEVIFKCETCTGFTSFGHTSSCQLTAKQSVVILPADIEGYTYTVENLNPYINYTIHVLGVNAAGDGHPNIIYGMTEQEVPQNPTALTAEVLSSTAIRVSWAISDPEPGPTSYTLYIIPETPEQSQTVTIQGFSTRTYNVTSLQEYRTYQFNLTASTVLGTAVFQQSLPSAKTNAAAPGQVSNFQVVRPDGPNFTTVRVSWELPAILDRNSDIIKYMFSHNSTVGNLGTAPEEILVNGNPATITRNLKVLPQNIYYIEVYAVGTDQNGVSYNGNKHFVVYSAPAGSPPLDVGETVIPTSSNNNIQPTQTSFSLTLTDAFFTNSIYGGIEDMALVLCKDSCKNLGDQSEAVSSNYLVNVDGWKVARSKGYTDEYRAMSKTEFTSYINQAGTSGRRKRSTNTFVVEIGTATDCASSTETYCNGPLEAGSVYFVKAVVCTAGGCTLSALYGPYSTEKVPDSGPDVGVIIGVVCAIVAFAVIVVIIVVFIKRRQSSKPSTYKPDDEEPGLHEIEKKHITAKRPVVMERFPQHVSDLHKDSKLKFAREYEDLKELSAKHPCNAANEDGNKLKNRYVNILPFDHSRVKLNPTDPEDPSTDFINANYIPGYNSPREYIASQGPIPSTIDDFWRMIWEQQVSICVMLTLCKEDGRIKCEQYWPTERNEPKQYGDIVVEITSYSTVNTYDHRIFKITQGDQTRTLKHFHFLNWKDFSANVQNDVMIDFIQNVRAHIQPPDKKGPMIIHCSAGVGRTGTYMALDQLIQFIDEHDFSEMIDIFDLVLSMRNYRVFMVQTEQQYVFIHDCAKDLIERKKARLQNNDDDENLYVNRAYEEDPDENLYQNQNFFENKTEL
ncbi:tyrosine-protein phosphatase 10D-like [Ylistrum balloti]|uniref:tyrosine-protein phosphatase 10D-like n=1 Tax=Ylistrum balloti TaxID=509963 RepID=UPI002905F5CB|nr:tyrosine-protein phosphatase 10D-like [Ylistrum balloti]